MYEKIGIGKPLNKYLENIGISKEYENETNAFMKAIIFKYVEKIKYDNKEKFKKEHNMTEEHYQKLQYDFTEEEHIPSIYDFNIPFRDGEF
ncbi:hypothetical protein GW932_01940 [archaeon]|nr:hypothetical protein [archaeon]